MSYRVEFSCDSCEKIWFIDKEEDLELPPYWIATHLGIADAEGFIPEHERNSYMHFCSIDCLKEYVNSNDLKRRKCEVDKAIPDDFGIMEEDDDDDDDED